MNKKLVKSIALMMIMLLAIVTLTGCGKEEGKGELDGLAVYTADADMAGYTKCDKVDGAEFYYPENYKSAGTSKQPIYTDPEILGASVNLVSTTYPSSYTFEAYIDASIANLKKQMSIQGDIDKEYINLNGNKACKISYVITASGMTMQTTQVMIVKDTKAYALTFGCLTKDKEEFQPKLDKMLKSFK